MQRRTVVGMALVLSIWAITNAIVIDAFGRNNELYPMTSWQMFSGRPKHVVRTYDFSITPHPNAPSIDVPGGDLLGVPAYGTLARRILHATWVSYRSRCPDYRLREYASCLADPVDRWELPDDIGRLWRDRAMKRLGLSQPPHSISLVRTETLLQADAVEDPPVDRDVLFTWHPASGSNRVLPP